MYLLQCDESIEPTCRDVSSGKKRGKECRTSFLFRDSLRCAVHWKCGAVAGSNLRAPRVRGECSSGIQQRKERNSPLCPLSAPEALEQCCAAYALELLPIHPPNPILILVLLESVQPSNSRHTLATIRSTSIASNSHDALATASSFVFLAHASLTHLPLVLLRAKSHARPPRIALHYNPPFQKKRRNRVV